MYLRKTKKIQLNLHKKNKMNIKISIFLKNQKNKKMNQNDDDKVFGKIGESYPMGGSDPSYSDEEEDQVPIGKVGNPNTDDKVEEVDMDDFTNLKFDKFDNSNLNAAKSEFDFRIPVTNENENIANMTVGDAKKNSKGIFNEFFTYKIYYNNNQVSRRFSDFDKLHKYLVNHYDFCFFPHLPDKNPLTKIKNLAGAEFLQNRRKSLEFFLKKLLTHSKCKEDSKVAEFLDGSFTEVSLLSINSALVQR